MRVRRSFELKLMRESGKIAASALQKALSKVKIGVSELEIDEIAEEEIQRRGGELSYKSVPGYKFATCITVNEEVVHGIPTKRKFEIGDLVSIDLAVKYRGWHTDCAWSILLGKDPGKEKFLKTGEEALWLGVQQAIDGNRVGDISNAIQSRIEGEGYSVVRSLVGHGIGKSLHEEPEIPCFGEKGMGVILKSGMTLAIEVIYAQGGHEVVLKEDGWTYFTADKSLGGLFEMTIVVGEERGEVLTDWHQL